MDLSQHIYLNQTRLNWLILESVLTGFNCSSRVFCLMFWSWFKVTRWILVERTAMENARRERVWTTTTATMPKVSPTIVDAVTTAPVAAYLNVILVIKWRTMITLTCLRSSSSSSDANTAEMKIHQRTHSTSCRSDPHGSTWIRIRRNRLCEKLPKSSF